MAAERTRETADDPHTVVLPDRMRGPQEGNAFVNCATCQYGLPKPRDHARDLLKDFPGLIGPPGKSAEAGTDATQGGRP